MDLVDQKVKIIVDEMGCSTTDEALAEACSDSVVMGICMNPGCEYTADIEPDCRDGHCECCGTQSVASILVLFNLI